MVILETRGGIGEIVSLEELYGDEKHKYMAYDYAGPSYDSEVCYFADIDGAFKKYCYFLKHRFDFILEGSLKEREHEV